MIFCLGFYTRIIFLLCVCVCVCLVLWTNFYICSVFISWFTYVPAINLSWLSLCKKKKGRQLWHMCCCCKNKNCNSSSSDLFRLFMHTNECWFTVFPAISFLLLSLFMWISLLLFLTAATLIWCRLFKCW